MSAPQRLKVGDRVRTPRGLAATVTAIRGDGRCDLRYDERPPTAEPWTMSGLTGDSAHHVAEVILSPELLARL